MSSDEEMRALASQIAVERMRAALPPIEPEQPMLYAHRVESRAASAESRIRELEAEVARLRGERDAALDVAVPMGRVLQMLRKCMASAMSTDRIMGRNSMLLCIEWIDAALPLAKGE